MKRCMLQYFNTSCTFVACGYVFEFAQQVKQMFTFIPFIHSVFSNIQMHSCNTYVVMYVHTD